MFDRESQIFENIGSKEKKMDASKERGKLYQEVLAENKEMPGLFWIEIWRTIGRVNQECEEFFKERKSAADALNFLAERGEFKKPDEIKIKKLLEQGKKEQAKIEIIQNCPLNPRDKIELLLCFFGEKPATTFIFEILPVHKNVSKAFAELSKKREKIIKEILGKLNLVYEIEEKEEISPQGEVKTFQLFHLSKSEEVLNKLIEAWKKNDEKQIGLLYGYPKTAIEAWTKSVEKTGKRPPLGESYDSPYILKRKDIPYLPEIPEEKREQITNLAKFANFVFSSENWKEELEELRKKVEIIKEKAPELYNEFLSSESL